MDVAQRVSDGLAELGVAAAPEVPDAMVRYLGLLERWNRAYNLTSISDIDDMVVRHILDCASALPFLAGSAVLDAGTGAGLPGLPLALLAPARRFTLVDSVGKKVRFLHQAVAELALANVNVVQARLERWPAHPRFDTVISRALASLADFAGLCGRLLASGGRLVAMKGRRPTVEVAALPSPWRVTALERVAVPGLAAERHIVVLER